MTLEETIKYEEEVAEKNEEESNNWTYGASRINNDESWRRKQYLKHAKKWHECANEHRQLAKWLKELKALKDFANFVAESVLEEDFEENSDFYAEAFCRKLHKMGFLESTDNKWIFNDEVNADDD